jgi:hypothetical protein
MDAGTVIADARDAGIEWWALTKARKAFGIQAERHGTGRGSVSTWRIPPDLLRPVAQAERAGAG